MEAHSVERKLAAIFAADVEGYSRLMGLDEVGALRSQTRMGQSAGKHCSTYSAKVKSSTAVMLVHMSNAFGAKTAK